MPVDGPVGPAVDPLWRRLVEEFRELAAGGCDPTLLRANALVTPVCGLAHHGITQAEQVFGLANGVAGRLNDAMVDLHLSFGT